MGPFFWIALDLTKYFQHSLKIISSGLHHSEALPSDVSTGANCPPLTAVICLSALVDFGFVGIFSKNQMTI